MPLTPEQLEVLQKAQNILHNANLISISPNEGLPDITRFQEIIQQNLSTSPPTASFIPTYLQEPAREFTPEESVSKLNQTTRKGKVHKIVRHPMHAILEYPESGQKPDEAIAHIFPIDPQNYTHPRYNMQYGLSTHGGRLNTRCSLFRDNSSEEYVLCNQFKGRCKFCNLLTILYI